MSLFETQLAALAVPPASPALPLTHITDWNTFLAIEDADAFKARAPCKVYGEPLVYAFYGRPAYRFNDTDTYYVPTYAPVCFLIKAGAGASAKRIVPFDTGAFHTYGAAIHPGLTKEAFELTPGSDSPARVVSTFWGDNDGYYSRNILDGVVIDPSANALIHYYHLIKNKHSNLDDRISSVEVQWASPLPLTGNIQAVVIPSIVYGRHVEEFGQKHGVDVLPYFAEMPFRRGDAYSPVRQTVRQYLQDHGFC